MHLLQCSLVLATGSSCREYLACISVMLQNADRHVDGRCSLSIQAFGPCAWKTLNAAFPVRKEHREQQVQACVSLPGKVLFTVGARDESVYIMIFRLIMQYVRDQDTIAAPHLAYPIH